MLPSPLRPHTTMAIEKLNRAAREAQPRVINITVPFWLAEAAYLGLGLPRSSMPRTSSSFSHPATATASATATPTRSQPALAGVRQQQPYPHFKVVVLNDDVNTFQHVVECLVKILPGMGSDRAWELAHQIDQSGSAVVWCGQQDRPSSTTSNSAARASPWLHWSRPEASQLALDFVGQRDGPGGDHPQHLP